MKRCCLQALLFLLLTSAAEVRAQYCWTVLSADKGTEVLFGEQETNLMSSDPWEPDIRDEWILEHTDGDVLHMRNGVVAALLDGSTANQEVLVENEDFWSDGLSHGARWFVNYDVHLVNVEPAEMADLRITMQFIHNGIVRLTLNLAGAAGFGSFRFRTAPTHSWIDTPETGNLWKIRLRLRRISAGEPAMIWIDNIRVTESTSEHYNEVFPIFGDGDYDGDVDVNDFALFLDCFSGEGVPYDPMECNVFDSDDDEDVDFNDFAKLQTDFSGEL